MTEHACDCPVEEPFCEHQVAVFLALREQLAQKSATAKGKKTAKAALKKKADLFDSVLNNLSEADLRVFVRRYAQKHKEFKSTLLIEFFEHDVPKPNIEGSFKADRLFSQSPKTTTVNAGDHVHLGGRS